MQAWRAVDKAYVDKGFNGQTWFRVKEKYLKEEPMTDRGETYAAIRKLLASLDDPFTRFLEPDKYAVLRRGASWHRDRRGRGSRVLSERRHSGAAVGAPPVAPAYARTCVR